jgi:hypothetical protein
VTVTPMGPLQCPGPAYRLAFDWLAVQLSARESNAAALVPTPFHALEMARRLPTLPLLAPDPAIVTAAAKILGLVPPPVASWDTRAWEALAWIEPQARQTRLQVQLSRALAPGGRLYLLAGGPLAPFLAERRSRLVPAVGVLTAATLLRLLRQAGLRVERQLGWHGPQAAAWFWAACLLGRAGRYGWRDRCLFAMHRAMLVRGPARPIVALRAIVAVKESGAHD